GCQLCAGVAGTEAAKILTRRGDIFSAPYNFHFDAYLNRYERSYLWLGHKNPLFNLKLKFAKRFLFKDFSKK
ncbi:MAG: hypothetical protein KDD61_18330, partial [Bdellovibrionales bacterium]|nr:hypothetical protein [Bdellovibrionales bacterium]